MLTSIPQSLQPATRRLREALGDMSLRGGETVIELDTRDDGGIIESALRRLVSPSASLPILLLNGQHVPIDVRQQGKSFLRAVLQTAGALKEELPSRWHRELRRTERE